MTRILYELWAAQPLLSNYHGGATYAHAVLERLVQLRRDEEIAVYYDPARWLDPDLSALLRSSGIVSLHIKDKKALQGLLSSREYDRLYSALPYDYYDLDLHGIEFAMTIHGLRPLEMPTDEHELKYVNGLRQWLKVRVKRVGLPLYVRMHKQRFRRLIHNGASHTTIIVPSWHTKHSLLNHFPEVDPGGVTVLYSPLRLPPSTRECKDDDRTTSVLRELGAEARGFFLLVNAGRWIKNAHRALTALDDFFTDRPSIDKTVLVLGVQEGQRLGRNLRNSERFNLHDYVPGPTLQLLYRNAFALVYPSLNEGFGYPPLECMRYGTPVICAATAALPELCGDAVLYCNPLSRDEIKSRVSYLILEPGVWDRCSRLGRERYGHIAQLQREMLDRLCHIILQGEDRPRPLISHE